MEGVGKSDESTVVHLNVGGAYFSTYKSTLCKYPGNASYNILHVILCRKFIIANES